MSETESIAPQASDEPTGQNRMSDSAVDGIAAIVVVACLVAIATTFISGGLA